MNPGLWGLDRGSRRPGAASSRFGADVPRSDGGLSGSGSRSGSAVYRPCVRGGERAVQPRGALLDRRSKAAGSDVVRSRPRCEMLNCAKARGYRAFDRFPRAMTGSNTISKNAAGDIDASASSTGVSRPCRQRPWCWARPGPITQRWSPIGQLAAVHPSSAAHLPGAGTGCGHVARQVREKSRPRLTGPRCREIKVDRGQMSPTAPCGSEIAASAQDERPSLSQLSAFHRYSQPRRCQKARPRAG